jgi:gluconate 2-dehydrogenase gamma chain
MISRRHLLQAGAAGGYLVFALDGCRRKAAPETARHFFTAAEWLTASAACERILPRDEDPGAIDLGVPAYLDGALAFDDHAHQAAAFREGLRGLDEGSRRRSGKPFHEASSIDQDNLLDDWQDGTPVQAAFVRMLMTLTMEGAFGDPSHGGNRGGQGWRLLGFEPCEPRHRRT